MTLPLAGGFSLFVGNGVAAEQQRDAPDGRKTYQGVDHPADRGRLAAEEPGHQVETEQAHAAPVDPADDGKAQGDAIHDHDDTLLSCRKRPEEDGRGHVSGLSLPVWKSFMQKVPFDKTGAPSLFTKIRQRIMV